MLLASASVALLEMEIVQFRFLYVGLPGLDAVQYLEGDNWLGVALSALMRIPKEKIAWLGAEALRRVIEAPLEERKRFLLGECVQAYLQMDESQQREYDRLLEAKPYQGVKAMNLTVFEKGEISGIQKGRQEGRQEGQREMLRDQMEDKFGELPREILDQLGKLPVERLYPLSRAILRANSLDDLGLVD